ncbi:MAG: thiamine-monophosphate kinase [Holophagales bacterium]|nr:MAG: thiamine-monophosphate kinase [Holophagales bacterium]
MSGAEDRLLGWLQRRLGPGHRLGDDVAFLDEGGGIAVTLDHQIEGVHFLPHVPPDVVARRLAAVNLSDLAASGAEPWLAFLALAAPAGFPHRRFLAALLGELSRFGVELAGGDLASAPRLSSSLTLLGKRRSGGRWVRRDGVRAGHRLWLGGTVGESLAGRELVRRGAGWERGRAVLPAPLGLPPALAAAARRAVRRHLLPSPQLDLGAWLARRRDGGGLDVSDGLSRDLHRLCRASGVGARLDSAALLPERATGRLLEQLGIDPLAAALGGGEDYVLLFSLPSRTVPPAHFGARPVGIALARPVVEIATPRGIEPLPEAGWDHLDAAARDAEARLNGSG